MKNEPKAGPANASATAAAIREAAAEWVARRDAGLTPAEGRDYQAWLDRNPLHRAAVVRFDSAWTALDRPLRTGTADLVLGELKARADRRSRRHLGFAAAGLAILFGVQLGWISSQREVTSEPAQPTKAVVVLPSLRSLPDGSVVEQREGAELTVDFTDTARRVTLRRGEAHFQVAKDPDRPFVVVAGGVEVRAVGTAFSVKVGQSAVEVLVTSGRVAVNVPSRPSAAGSGQHAPALQTLALVDAGNGVVVDKPADPETMLQAIPMPAADVNERLAWRSPRLEFSGMPLIEAVTLLNRHNRVQFIIEDPELAQARVSGIFGALNTEAFVRVLETSFDATAERRGENEIVLRRKRKPSGSPDGRQKL